MTKTRNAFKFGSWKNFNFRLIRKTCSHTFWFLTNCHHLLTKCQINFFFVFVFFSKQDFQNIFSWTCEFKIISWTHLKTRLSNCLCFCYREKKNLKNTNRKYSRNWCRDRYLKKLNDKLLFADIDIEINFYV